MTNASSDILNATSDMANASSDMLNVTSDMINAMSDMVSSSIPVINKRYDPVSAPICCSCVFVPCRYRLKNHFHPQFKIIPDILYFKMLFPVTLLITFATISQLSK